MDTDTERQIIPQRKGDRDSKSCYLEYFVNNLSFKKENSQFLYCNELRHFCNICAFKIEKTVR